MLLLRENETIIFVIHKHWFVLARFVVVFLILLLLPPLVLTFLSFFTEGLDPRVIDPIVNFLLSLYILVLLLLIFLFWMDYYLDMWIITTKRVIDIEQRGLFSRQIAEIPIEHIQDVTIEIHGLIETFLKFGTIKIQTAGEREFKINNIPHLYEVKDAILKYANGEDVPRFQKL